MSNESLVYRNLLNFINPYGYIYEIKNLINNKRYIGQTINERGFRGKWTLNGIKRSYQNNNHLIRAVEKYRINNFERKIIDSALNKEELDKKEEFYIKKHDTLNPINGYNLKHGGANGKFAKETKNKMSRSRKKYCKNNPNSQVRENNPMFGKHHSEESKNNIREKLKGKNSSTYRHDLEYITRDFLIKEYWCSEYNMLNRILDTKQKTILQIAKENNCSSFYIQRKRKKFYISIKNSSEATKLMWMKKGQKS